MNRLAFLLLLSTIAFGAPPTVIEKAPDLALKTPTGPTVRISEMTAKGPVFLVVPRGYPGYQCPYCNRQIQDFIQKAEGFAAAGANLNLVYAGPPADLHAKAKEFVLDKTLPDNFDLVLHPDYEFTNSYGLCWDAPHETVYPSTFPIDRQGAIFFSKIIKEYGGRTTAAEIPDAMPKRQSAELERT